MNERMGWTGSASAQRSVPAPTCDGWCGGRGEVSSIDTAGFVYCDPCGDRRRFSEPCRRLTVAELERVRGGLTVAAY